MPADAPRSAGSLPAAAAGGSIALHALGYFACYVPYSGLTKLLADGALPGMARPLSGLAMLPVSTITSLAAMVAFVTTMGWWRHATHRTVFGVRVLVPRAWTLASGIASSAVIATTTLSYAFDGLSIVFMMLLMRGGVLVLAPIIDKLAGRHVRTGAWGALALSLGAMALAVVGGPGYRISFTAPAAVTVAVYLGGYFVRLRLMSRHAKNDDANVAIGYFVEETMVATPVLLVTLAALAVVGHGPAMLAVRAGFTEIVGSGALAAVAVLGVLSQGTGAFGALILLDGRENAFCVPVNRASSVVAGVVASAALALIGRARPPSPFELVGALMLCVALALLAWGPRPGRVAKATS